MIRVGYDRIKFFKNQKGYNPCVNYKTVNGNGSSKVYKYNFEEEMLDCELTYTKRGTPFSISNRYDLDLNVARSINNSSNSNYGNLCIGQTRETLNSVFESVDSAIETEISLEESTLKYVELAFDLSLDNPFDYYKSLFVRAFPRYKRSFIKGSTLYFGNYRSPISFLIYDKSRELREGQGIDSLGEYILRIEAIFQYKAIREYFGTKVGYRQLVDRYDEVVNYLKKRYLKEFVKNIRQSKFYSRNEMTGSPDFSVFGKNSTTAEIYYHFTKSVLNDYDSVDLYWEEKKQDAIKNDGKRQYDYKLSDYRKYEPFIMHFILSDNQVPLCEIVEEFERKLNQANLPNQHISVGKSDFSKGIYL